MKVSYEVGQKIKIQLTKSSPILEFEVISKNKGWYKIRYLSPVTNRYRIKNYRASDIKRWEDKLALFQSKLWKVLS